MEEVVVVVVVVVVAVADYTSTVAMVRIHDLLEKFVLVH
jgi:hypothetical protein